MNSHHHPLVLGIAVFFVAGFGSWNVYRFLDHPPVLVAEEREYVGNAHAKANLIRTTNLVANSIVSTPLTIKGQARGVWFFEGSFPVEIIGTNGAVLGKGIAEAEGEWMTEQFVPFVAKVQFSPQGDEGMIRLKKDNPSGLPEHDDVLIVPIRFK